MIFATAFKLGHKVRESFPDVDFVSFDGDSDPKGETLGILGSADAVYAGQNFFTQANLEVMAKVRWIQVPSAGYERVDRETARGRGIILTNARGAYSIPIAEDVICKMLCLARNYRAAMRDQGNRVWNRAGEAFELYGRTVGLIGTGSIASEIACRAKAMGMTVLGVNRSGKVPPCFDNVGTGRAALLDLAGRSDFLVATVPLDTDTDQLIDAEVLAACKTTAYFINIARGGVVDEGALVSALRTRRIAGAALDVFQEEPLPGESLLWGLDNVIITPHTAGSGDGDMPRLEQILIANLRGFPEADLMVNVITD